MEEMSKSNSIWASTGFWIKQLHNAGYFLEEIADDILSEYLRDYTIRYNEDWEFIK
jgi:benzoyl-CoA reductase/2-hydroxyglutaryl-CoA dehydratase subunit BcrC/BadD/HgdB